MYNSKIYLCKPNNKKFIQLNGIRLDTVSVNKRLKDFGEIGFEVDKYISINGEKCKSNGYEELHNGMELYLDKDKMLFKMSEPEVVSDGERETPIRNATN